MWKLKTSNPRWVGLSLIAWIMNLLSIYIRMYVCMYVCRLGRACMVEIISKFFVDQRIKRLFHITFLYSLPFICLFYEEVKNFNSSIGTAIKKIMAQPPKQKRKKRKEKIPKIWTKNECRSIFSQKNPYGKIISFIWTLHKLINSFVSSWLLGL
jgi:hypothetical protein